MGRTLSLLRRVGFRDWRPSRFAGAPVVDFAEQIRIYSNGFSSALVRLVKGEVVEIEIATEVYALRSPIASLWPKVLPHLRYGVGLLYIGGLDNQVQLRNPITPPAQEDHLAVCSYPIGKGSTLLHCGTYIPPALFAQFRQCAERRVPVEVVDELSSCLDVLSGLPNLIVDAGGLTAVLVIFDHIVYVILYRGPIVLGVGAHEMRTGGALERLDFARPLDHVKQLLGDDDIHAMPSDIQKLVVCDTTSSLDDGTWREALGQAIADSGLGHVESDVRLPERLGLERMTVGNVEASNLRTTARFPMPLTGFWPSKPL